MYTPIRLVASLVTLLLALPVSASEGHLGSLTITQPWSRATAPGASTGAAYFDIINSGPADTLLRIESPIAREVQVHMEYTAGGMMHMRPMASVEVPQRDRVRFQPGGLHVMLIDLKQSLHEGQRFPLTLVFQHSGTVRVEVIVQGLGAMAAPGHGAGTHEHHH